MSRNLLERGATKYRRDGFASLAWSTVKFAFRQPVIRHFLVVDDEEVFSYADRLIETDGRTESTIKYSGANDPPHPSQITSVEGWATADPRVVCEFRNATLVGNRSLIRVGGKYIPPSAIGNSGVNQRKARNTFRKTVRPRELIGGTTETTRSSAMYDTAFLLTGYFPVFGHWTFEILPKLLAYERYAQQTDTTPEIITIPELNSWQRESLALLGYAPDQVVCKPEGRVAVRRLLVPSHRYLTWTHVPSYPSRTDLKWVRDRISENVTNTTASFGNRIYISREDASRRRVRNHDAVVEVLAEYDFEVYEPGRLSFAEQVQLFTGADIVVGPYGAGVSNIVFADDIDFVELVVDEERNIHHFVLANLLDINYEYVSCRPLPTEDVEPRQRDVEVDITHLREILDTIG